MDLTKKVHPAFGRAYVVIFSFVVGGSFLLQVASHWDAELLFIKAGIGLGVFLELIKSSLVWIYTGRWPGLLSTRTKEP